MIPIRVKSAVDCDANCDATRSCEDVHQRKQVIGDGGCKFGIQDDC